MRVTTYLLSSFGKTRLGGNPAGVVLDSGKLDDKQKLFISKRLGFSETAFVEKSNKADFKVTFFTPTEEVDLCGHATIATYSLLFQLGVVKKGLYTQDIKAGILNIKISDEGVIWMQQPLPIYSEFDNLDDLNNIFNQDLSFTGLKPEIVSTGMRDIFLPVSDLKELFSLNPDFEKLSNLNRITKTVGLHAFTLESVNVGSQANSRNFCPLYGIDEESATGSSNGALACYLHKHNKLDKQNEILKFEQGYSMGQESEILVELKVFKGKIKDVEVGGKAILFEERIIDV